jgi:mycothiol synthase
VTPGALLLRTTARLTEDQASAVLALAAEAAGADGAHPLAEHVVLHLRHGGLAAQHLLVTDAGSGALLGYAHLDASDPVEGPAAELAVSPRARRRGVGSMLIEYLSASDPEGRLRLWAHGADAAAAQLAAAHGFRRVRRLWQMRRSLFAPLAPVEMPEGIHLRTFDAGRDAEEWLALNARAFTELPDQGRWTRADVDRRLAEPWFDADGFLLAEDREGRLVGFHWTKVHGHHHAPGDLRPGTDHSHPHDPLGEVYVLGVDPAHRGLGLGRALTLAGLHSLRRAGLSTALLYVDATNTRAIALYRSLGFADWDSDTLFRR